MDLGLLIGLGLSLSLSLGIHLGIKISLRLKTTFLGRRSGLFTLLIRSAANLISKTRFPLVGVLTRGILAGVLPRVRWDERKKIRD